MVRRSPPTPQFLRNSTPTKTSTPSPCPNSPRSLSPLGPQPTLSLCRASDGPWCRYLYWLSRRSQHRIRGIVGTRRGKLLQRRTYPATTATVDTRATVRAAGYPPTVYWSVSSMRVPVPPVWNATCSLGLFGLRVDGRFGVRRWSRRFCFDSGDLYLLSTAFMTLAFWLRLNKLNKELWFFK